MSGKKRRDSIGQLNNHGFSLLELLVVMAIIVIVYYNSGWIERAG